MDKRTIWLCLIIGVTGGFLNGLLGSGGGMIILPALKYTHLLEEKKAHATTVATILPLCIISGVLYAVKNYIDYNILLYVSIGGIAGGLIGAKLLFKLPEIYLRRAFGIVLLIVGIKAVM